MARIHSTLYREPNGVEIEVFPNRGQIARPVSYDADHLKVWFKDLDFLRNDRFRDAYRRGMDSGHHIMRPKGSKIDLHIEFRVHTILWAATLAAKLEGDFVECGVNTGIYSLALCHYIDFNATGKSFYLFDTFDGIPLEQVTAPEAPEEKRDMNNSFYSECYELAKSNFALFPKVQIIRGRVPVSLETVNIDKVGYLSIDMNIAYPERKAIEFFWEKLVPGAPVVLDDYAWFGHNEQKRTLDEFAAAKGTAILTLPTGQGLLIKA